MFDRPLAAQRRSISSIILSVAIHGALAAALIAVRFSVDAVHPRRNARVLLVAPAPAAPRPRIAMRAPSKTPQIHAALKLPAPAPLLLAPPLIEAPAVAIKAPPMPMVVAEVAPRKPIVQTEVFSSPTPAPAKAAPVAQVQTGGFSGASTTPIQSDRATQVVAAGFGDAGTAPSTGARRAVATGGGFGDAGVGAAAGGSRRLVASSGFGDTVAAAPTTGGARQTTQASQTAAQILEKPRPAYTEEARRLRIEGEVQLEVLFRASGQIDILRVVRGLGHGLDENAAQAARTIRFLPARREGRPVDSTATVHIIFQLAS